MKKEDPNVVLHELRHVFLWGSLFVAACVAVFILLLPVLQPNGVVYNDKCLSLCKGHAGAKVHGDTCQCLDVTVEFNLKESDR